MGRIKDFYALIPSEQGNPGRRNKMNEISPVGRNKAHRRKWKKNVVRWTFFNPKSTPQIFQIIKNSKELSRNYIGYIYIDIYHRRDFKMKYFK